VGCWIITPLPMACSSDRRFRTSFTNAGDVASCFATGRKRRETEMNWKLFSGLLGMIVAGMTTIIVAALLVYHAHSTKVAAQLELADPKPPAALVAEDIEFPPRSGVYQAVILEVIDGDTVRIGWIIPESRGRLFGINAPEMTGKEKVQGQASKKWLTDKLQPPSLVTVRVRGREKYGGPLLEIFRDGKSVNAGSIEAGHAKPWDGHGERP